MRANEKLAQFNEQQAELNRQSLVRENILLIHELITQVQENISSFIYGTITGPQAISRIAAESDNFHLPALNPNIRKVIVITEDLTYIFEKISQLLQSSDLEFFQRKLGSIYVINSQNQLNLINGILNKARIALEGAPQI